MNELIPIQNPNIPMLFQPMGLQTILDQIEADARTLVPDLSTKKGRDAIASTAARVARSKTYLDDLGKKYVAELKELPKQVDAERKRMRDRLDALRDEVRQPLTDWEQAETDRVNAIKARIASMDAPPARTDVASIQARIDEVSAVAIDESFAEFEPDAMKAKGAALYVLSKQLEQAQEAERIAAERAAKAAKEQQEREERIAAEAAAKAKAEAERISAEEHARVEAARKAAEQAQADAERRAREAEEKAIAQAAAARKAAEQAQAEAAERAAAQAAAAVKLEHERIERVQREQAAAEEKRAADREHTASINREILCAMTDVGITEDHAKELIRRMAKGEIPHVQIKY